MFQEEDKYEIEVIKPGVLVRDRFGTILDARSVITLIVGKSVKILVDTGLYSERIEVINALSGLNLVPNDIDVLINTHSHSDHIGNNDLFNAAEFIGHISEFNILRNRPNHRLISEDTHISSNLMLIQTPGHTRGSLSIIVKGTLWMDPNKVAKSIAITGDALPIMDNYIKWVPPGINYDPQIALESMSKIIALAEIIIPGHDKPFEILEKENNMNHANYLY